MRIGDFRAALGDHGLAAVLPVDDIDGRAARARHGDKRAPAALLHLAPEARLALLAHERVQRRLCAELAEHARHIDALTAEAHGRPLARIILARRKVVDGVELIDGGIRANDVNHKAPLGDAVPKPLLGTLSPDPFFASRQLHEGPQRTNFVRPKENEAQVTPFTAPEWRLYSRTSRRRAARRRA